MKTGIISRLVLLLVLASPAAYVSAQVQLGVLGKIDSVMLDDGYIVIDGKRLVVREGDLVITYKGEPFRSSFLNPGLSVRYSTRADGSVSELMLIGPSLRLDRTNNQ